MAKCEKRQETPVEPPVTYVLELNQDEANALRDCVVDRLMAVRTFANSPLDYINLAMDQAGVKYRQYR